MRKTVRMTFIKSKNVKGYMGHWGMNYYVEDVIEIESGEKICDKYIFENSTIFKGKGFKFGDVIQMDIRITYNKEKVKFSYYTNIKRVT